MGRRGPQPRPTALKLLRGNPGKRSLNTQEPRPDPACPDPPMPLSKGAAAAWQRIVPQLHTMGVLTKIDADALALWCETYSQWLQVLAALKRKGYTQRVDSETSSRITARPEVAIERALRRDLIAHGRDFGLTPSSRSNLKTTPPEAKDPLQAFLDGTHGK